MKLLLFSTIILFIGCSSHSDNDVIVIEKTKSYHRDWCARVNMAKVETMPLAKAESLHYNPCPLCIK